MYQRIAHAGLSVLVGEPGAEDGSARKLEVSDSYTGRRSGMWRSQAAHLLWEQGVGGSNPPIPTSELLCDQ